MLTTTDNPFDPFTQWDDWYLYDFTCGYRTCEYLDRIACTSSDFSDEKNDKELERAMDEIVALNPLGIYVKKVREVSNDTVPPS